uniref:HAT C-terminal dimerisation domain-containing protein n=1 Tax=Strigamia maritima TaxID=126957 RepID=T1IYC5_STRMM
MARDFLAIPGTSVPIEREFSGGVDLLTPNQRNLSTECGVNYCLCQLTHRIGFVTSVPPSHSQGAPLTKCTCQQGTFGLRARATWRSPTNQFNLSQPTYRVDLDLTGF